jgi:tRNA (cytidine32/uridine32-2'-O)-methyltransferase
MLFFIMNFNRIRIVLVETSHPGNIGSTARAMKTMGLSRLYLVTPVMFPDRRAQEMAAGADDILENAVVTSELSDALRGCQMIFATSARARDIGLPGLTPRECAEKITELSDDTEIAVVFGREQSGLSNQELLQCHCHIHVPTDPSFSSLNLSQAVQIVAYEIRMQGLAPKAHATNKQDTLATAEQIELFYQHLESVLIQIDFLKLSNPKRLQQRLRRLFNRATLETMEVNILRGILTHIEYAIAHGTRSK